MEDLLARAEQLGADLLDLVEQIVGAERLAGASDDEAMRFAAAAGQVLRAAEALATGGVDALDQRSNPYAGPERLSARLGCRSVNELVQRSMLIGSASAGRFISAARAVRRDVSPSSGERMPAEFPCMREALIDGAVGLDGTMAVVKALAGVAGIAGREAQRAADAELAASARGCGPDDAPPAVPDDLRAQATVWATYLDQDGSEPAEARAMRKRGIRLGFARDGVVPISGNLLPETAAQFRSICDSIDNPKVDESELAPGRQPDVGGAGPRFRVVESGDEGAESGADDDAARVDVRTREQRHHDALATALTIAAGSGELPQLGGAAPTLVVSVREEDLESGRGRAHLDGEETPVSMAVARHTACAGRIQRVVFDDQGRILSLGILDRVFNHHQRRAIAARDGSCVIPGCRVRAKWCEIHHVDEYADGGPTHTDNGVLLCWFHHRTIDSEGWRVRMNGGVPEVRAPVWWDPAQRWRRSTTSPTRLRDRIARAP
ncbi:HNH endonuclease signature motif containing protein [Microbacterium thalassium]|uniref:HNH nuclease domain-containing protein n=1 Tax=Microbacterium thalassium TaxID=362649 RepID=A0A7X0FMC5_9MICO|nr:HNH endonuclease signature motif containing protein [Microbacterium thalassium]MBB6390128.1 hypothetical protein [Microbacterium thalassium]GLK25236.1 hypothetical protein GCM10017607_25550 [Microbacterium thalassium]